jgi:uncharacterized protein (TIGR04222 family)
MAAHGEIRWPPVGRFNGRLRGDSHGRRHPRASDPKVDEITHLALAEQLRFDMDVIETLTAWLIGWKFAAVFVTLLVIFRALAARERRFALERADAVDAGELDQYELAMLDEAGDGIDAVRLAVVSLLYRGALQPGPQFGPQFSFFDNELDSEAHPLERNVLARVRDLPSKPPRRLLGHLAKGDAVMRTRSGLVGAGLLYPRNRGLALQAGAVALFLLPYVSIAVWAARLSDSAGRSVTGLIVGLLALGLAWMLIVVGPGFVGATDRGSAARAGAEQRASPERPDDERQNEPAVQELLRAYAKYARNALSG